MDRRNFFHPRAISKGMETVKGLLETQQLPNRLPLENQLIRFSRKAMGTVFEWTFPFGLPDIHILANKAFDLIDHLESLLSAYQSTSEVCRINREGQLGDWQSLSEPLWELCTKSRNLWQQTNGAFDPTIGSLIQAWGFLRGPFLVPLQTEIDFILSQSGMQKLEFHATQRKIKHLGSTVDWNFGAIGKGFAIDYAAKWLTSRMPDASFLIHSGRSSIYSKGDSPSEELGWEVQVNHPLTGESMAKLRLKDGALGTSATTFNKFEVNGKTYGHVLDPRSGYPSDALDSATVFAPDSATADALSTAVFVAGKGLAEKLTLDNPSLGFLLLEKTKGGKPLVLGSMKDMLVSS